MGLGTEQTPVHRVDTCPMVVAKWKRKVRGREGGKEEKRRQRERERNRKWEGKRDSRKRNSKGRAPRERREGREKLGTWGEKGKKKKELRCPGDGVGLPRGPCLSLWPSVSSSFLTTISTPYLMKVCLSNRFVWTPNSSPMKCLAFFPGSCFSPLPELCSEISNNNVKAHIWGKGSSQLRPWLWRVSSIKFRKILHIHGKLGGCGSLYGPQSKWCSKLIKSTSSGKYLVSARVGAHSLVLGLPV